MKKGTLASIVGIIAVILIAGGIYAASKSGAISGAKPGEYTNSAYGITFSYPTSYIAQDKDIGGDSAHHSIILISKEDKEKLTKGTLPPQGPTSITVDVYPLKNASSLDEWIGTAKEANLSKATSGIATTTIGGTFAIAYSWNGTYRTNSIVFEHKNNIFMVSMTYTSLQDQIWKDFPTVLKSIKLN